MRAIIYVINLNRTRKGSTYGAQESDTIRKAKNGDFLQTIPGSYYENLAVNPDMYKGAYNMASSKI